VGVVYAKQAELAILVRRLTNRPTSVCAQYLIRWCDLETWFCVEFVVMADQAERFQGLMSHGLGSLEDGYLAF
jgi:hypothetical protein